MNDAILPAGSQLLDSRTCAVEWPGKLPEAWARPRGFECIGPDRRIPLIKLPAGIPTGTATRTWSRTVIAAHACVTGR